MKKIDGWDVCSGVAGKDVSEPIPRPTRVVVSVHDDGKGAGVYVTLSTGIAFRIPWALIRKLQEHSRTATLDEIIDRGRAGGKIDA